MADVAPDDKQKRDRERALLLALFLLLVDDTDAHLRTSVAAYLAGSVSIHSLSRNLTAALLGAHAQAVWMGRRLAGVTAPMGETDMQFAQTVMRGQAPFLTGLLNDLNAARYPAVDGEMAPSLVNRLGLYAKRVRGTAEEAWLLALPGDTRINWVLGFNENHCPECPTLAAEGPYRADSMPTTPGAGDTPCLSSCHCFLITADNQACFKLP